MRGTEQTPEYTVVKLSSLKNGVTFFCWGDYFLNYNYYKWCECIKISDNEGQEVDGINFSIEPSSKVSLKL